MNKFSELVKQKGLTIYGLGKKTGINCRTFEKWKLRGVPKSVYIAVKAARALGCSVEDLLDEE